MHIINTDLFDQNMSMTCTKVMPRLHLRAIFVCERFSKIQNFMLG